MKNLLNPRWLLLLNTVPVIILFLICIGEFNTIKTLLDQNSIKLWHSFGLILLIVASAHLIYTITALIKKTDLSLIYAITSLIIYTIFLYNYACFSDDILPFNIPRWMLSGDLIIYVGTFLMPTLAHSLFLIVIKITSREKNHKAWVSFALSAAIPILWYLFIQIILPLSSRINSGFNNHVMIIGMVIGVILFLLFLIRTIYILALKRGKRWTKYQLAWKIPLSIIFPLLGLAVNQGFIFNRFTMMGSGIFGNFNSHWFFTIAALNGIILCLPSLKNKYYRLINFTLKCITFAYTFYFFIVFLPFLPLSVIAIIALGIGFLMLTPLVLFIIHIQDLSKDFKFLKLHFNKRYLIITALIGVSIIPICINLSYINDKSILHETLDYVYNPSYSKIYAIDKCSLKKTLAIVIKNKDRNPDFINNSQTPYLSSFFNWLVLDNLTLSNKKINTIQQVFFNEQPFFLSPENIRNKDVNISNINTKSTYNEVDKSWTSWIDLEITNATNNGFSEYATTIDLPVGCWINNYYLYVGDRKEMGILAEKKSAMWVFSQIRNENKDPGLLYYLTGNKVAFRVFPFAQNETRKTGIQFIHKDPVTLTLDQHQVVLGEKRIEKTSINTSNNEEVIYISSEEKQQLQKINRSPYYHFIIDTSKDKDSLKQDYKNVIEQFIGKNNFNIKKAKISFTNSFTSTIAYNTNWETTLDNQKFEGGFYLKNAIKKTLFHSYKAAVNSYPIIVVVTDAFENSILDKDFSDFKITYPDSNLFYHLNTTGSLASHNLSKNPKIATHKTANITFENPVFVWPNLDYPTAYLADNNQASIALKSTIFELDETLIKPSTWKSGLAMQGKHLANTLHPEYEKKEWNTMVKYSFISKIMTPLTSYIVVENEAQKAVLMKKQKQVLSGKKVLDLNDDTQRMSEPELLLLIGLFCLFIILNKKRIRITPSNS